MARQGQAHAQTFTRRDFLHGSLVLAGGALVGCSAARHGQAASGDAAFPPRFEAATESQFPLLEVRGDPYDIGHAIGTRFAAQIRGGFEARAEWFRDLKAAADSFPRSVEETYVAAAKKHAPAVWEELRGWADGSGVPFRDLLILNLKAEYQALKEQDGKATCHFDAGCSTIVTHAHGRTLIAHNEDGDLGYLGRMFMLRLHPTGKPSCLCVSYPGLLPGNAPWVNERGVIMTTNFIYTREVRLGVGRYFLDRLAMGASSLDEAAAVCRHPERGYAFHHVIASIPEQRVVSLEVTPTRHSQMELGGLFLHTNHLIHPSLAAEPQNQKYVGLSSKTRWRVLSAWREAAGAPAGVTEEQIVKAMQSHEGRPYSPCRHAQGEIRGSTLLLAVFDVAAGRLRVYREQPCGGHVHDYPFAKQPRPKHAVAPPVAAARAATT